jgi:hypothetical protein
MNWFVEKIERFINSFDTKNEGFSGRKLSAFFGVSIAGFITAKYCTNTSLNEILVIWLVFVAFCLGLVTASQIISFRSGKSENNNTD